MGGLSQAKSLMRRGRSSADWFWWDCDGDNLLINVRDDGHGALSARLGRRCLRHAPS